MKRRLATLAAADMQHEDHDWLRTLGMIGLYRRIVETIVPFLREAAGTPDLSAAVADGRLPRRGKLRGFIDFRVRGKHLVVLFQKFRVEFNHEYPDAFSVYLLRRHIELNRVLRRSFPQYIGLPLARDLDELRQRQLVKLVDDTAGLFELTPEGDACERELHRAERGT